MKSLATQYFAEVLSLLSQIQEEEAPAIEKAASILADAIQDEKRIFGFGCSHSSLPVQDLVYRAGGLMLINPIYGPGIEALTTRPTTLGSAMERLSGYAQALLDNTPIQAGDVLLLVSVSGRNAVPVEMAQIASERGIRVIGITSHRYAQAVTSRHPSGKKMHDFAEVILDNKVPHGDAVLAAEGIPQKFCPASGVTSTALLHALVGATIEALLERGVIPPVFLAANVDGGEEYNKRLLRENRDRIFYL